MKAVLNDRVLADADDVVEAGGYAYFPRSAVRMECLAAAPRTADDRACPHGVRFYDVTVDGVRAPRAAWSYEAPLPALEAVRDRIGFWNEVETG